MAGPWAYPGDLQLRHDLQLLADAGLFNAPLTTWPLSFPDLAAGLAGAVAPADAPASLHLALGRVQQRLRRESRTGLSEPMLGIALADNSVQLRTFADTPREEAEATVGAAWLGKRFAWRLQATAVDEPDDDKQWRLDGSYGGMVLGNWMLSAGAMPRWWGPGWDGSLILSTNARPVPALALQRNFSTPFQTPWLSWLGPWRFDAFAGQLESDRHISDAKLLGARFSFKPTASLEIGLSRTAQWGGNGRPEDLDSFFDMLTGLDNRGQGGVNEANEPGNQLAGYDLRWASPIGRAPYALYTQFIGEDESSGLPSRFIGMAGIEIWGTVGNRHSYRLYIEAADTQMSFYRGDGRFDSAYNHSIYQSGYRYRGRPIGHAMDNDGQMISLGAVLLDASGRSWRALLRRTELNRDGAGLNAVSPQARTILGLELSAEQPLNDFQTVLWGVGIAEDELEASGETDTDVHAFVQWRYGF